MKIQLVSDIHLEFGHSVRIENAGADVLILAGDICCARSFNGKERDIDNIDVYQFFDNITSIFDNVIYVMGNHEHYKHTFNDTEHVLKDAFSEYKNLHILNNKSIVIDGVRFIGSSLWTDLNNNCPATKALLEQGMNDYRLIKYRDLKDNYTRLTPDITYSEHRLAINYIGHELNDNKDQPCVVITHHAPSPKSIHQKYQNEKIMNGGFSSDLEHMMVDNVKLWCHGHMHDSFDYVVNNTRVVCNPFGYPGERKTVNAKLVLEI